MRQNKLTLNSLNHFLKYSLIGTLSTSLLSGCLFGDDGKKVIPTPPPPPSHHATKLPPNPGYCPKPETLQRQPNMSWAAPNGWGSHTPSFSKHISSFIGAQWQGLSNGTVLCIYKGDQGDFSIALNTSRFLEAPWGANWQALHLKRPKPDDIVQKATYVINCVSIHTELCPFPKGSKIWTEKDLKVNPEDNKLNSRVLSN